MCALVRAKDRAQYYRLKRWRGMDFEAGGDGPLRKLANGKWTIKALLAEDRLLVAQWEWDRYVAMVAQRNEWYNPTTEKR